MQLYDKVIEETLTLKNPGKVEFTYSVFDVAGFGELVPGTLAVSPSTVSAPLTSITLPLS